MRWVIAFSTLLWVTGCTEDRSSPTVAPEQITTDSPPETVSCRAVSNSTRGFDPSDFPTPSDDAGSEGRAEFGQAVVEALEPMILGADANNVVAALRGSGWTVTVVDDSAATTTMTPDLLWNRLVVSICDGRVNAVAFD